MNGSVGPAIQKPAPHNKIRADFVIWIQQFCPSKSNKSRLFHRLTQKQNKISVLEYTLYLQLSSLLSETQSQNTKSRNDLFLKSAYCINPVELIPEVV